MTNKIFKKIGYLLSKTYKYKDSHFSDESYINFFIWQKILRINSHTPWLVHFTSHVTGAHNIKLGKNCSPGSNLSQYIQAVNGIIMGDNVLMGPGSKIISANHDPKDFTKHIKTKPVIIGSNVWIGADVVILPGITIGDNVIIGAGSIVTKDIPSNSIAVGNPCEVIKKKEKYSKETFLFSLLSTRLFFYSVQDILADLKLRHTFFRPLATTLLRDQDNQVLLGDVRVGDSKP